jgi:hypothetical protein
MLGSSAETSLSRAACTEAQPPRVPYVWMIILQKSPLQKGVILGSARGHDVVLAATCAAFVG